MGLAKMNEIGYSKRKSNPDAWSPLRLPCALWRSTMVLHLSIMGRRCDLALHPISSKTAEKVRTLGREIYKQKYIQWWRNGNTSTCGMKYDDDCVMRVSVDGKDVPFDSSHIADEAVLLRRRIYFNTKVSHLCLLGYDDEYCNMTWQWNNVENFDPDKFEFFVQRWDRVLKVKDFLIIDDVRYDGKFADEQDWGGGCGFNLVDPMVIDMEEVRREIAQEEGVLL